MTTKATTVVGEAQSVKGVAEVESSVPNFSDRFNQLLDLAGFPPRGDGRIFSGADSLKVKRNTFRGWAVQDKPPRSYAELARVVTELLQRAGRPDIPCGLVIGWLYQGHYAGPSPLKAEEPTDQLSKELFVAVRIQANKKGIDYNSLSENKRRLIMSMAYTTAKQKIAAGATPNTIGTHPEVIAFIDNLLNISE